MYACVSVCVYIYIYICICIYIYMGVCFLTVTKKRSCLSARVLGHLCAKRHEIQCQTTESPSSSTKQVWPTHLGTKYVRRMRVPLHKNHLFAATCVPAAVLLTFRNATHLHFSLAAHVCVQILQTRLLHRCLAPSHSPNALLPSFPLRSSTIPHRLLCLHPSPLRLLEPLPMISLRVCAVRSFKALKHTMVRATTIHYTFQHTSVNVTENTFSAHRGRQTCVAVGPGDRAVSGLRNHPANVS